VVASIEVKDDMRLEVTLRLKVPMNGLRDINDMIMEAHASTPSSGFKRQWMWPRRTRV